MHARAEAIMLPARKSLVHFVVRICASTAILFSGCATERNSRTPGSAPSGAAVTRLQSPAAMNPARDPAVARTAKAAQEPDLAEPPAEIMQGSQKMETATREADLNVPVPSPPVIPPPVGEYPIDLSSCATAGRGREPHHRRRPGTDHRGTGTPDGGRGHSSCPRSIPAQTITSILETSSDRPARS